MLASHLEGVHESIYKYLNNYSFHFQICNDISTFQSLWIKLHSCLNIHSVLPVMCSLTVCSTIHHHLTIQHVLCYHPDKTDEEAHYSQKLYFIYNINIWSKTYNLKNICLLMKHGLSRKHINTTVKCASIGYSQKERKKDMKFVFIYLSRFPESFPIASFFFKRICK